jgi:hypothetical protein
MSATWDGLDAGRAVDTRCRSSDVRPEPFPKQSERGAGVEAVGFQPRGTQCGKGW